MARWT